MIDNSLYLIRDVRDEFHNRTILNIIFIDK